MIIQSDSMPISLDALTWLKGPIELTVVYGQSLADDHSGEGQGVYYGPTMVPFQADRLKMMNNPRAPGRTFQGPFDPTTATNFIPLQDGRLVTTISQPLGQSLACALNWLDQDDIAQRRPLKTRLFLVCGEGGTTIAQLSKGAAPFVGSAGTFVIYDRMRAMVQQAVVLAAMFGRTISMGRAFLLQSEADAQAGTPVATWKAAALQLQADMRADMAIDTGDHTPFPIIWYNTPTPPTALTFNPGALAQIQMALENADGHTYTTGPIYWHPFASSEHMSITGACRQGDAFGRVASNLIDGVAPDFCYATGATLSGQRVTVNCHVPSPPLVIDTTSIPDATGGGIVKGFKFTDSLSTAISAVSIGPDGKSVLIDLAGVPGTGCIIEGAYSGIGNTNYTDPLTSEAVNTPGGWCNIFNSRATPLRTVPGSIGRDALASFQIAL